MSEREPTEDWPFGDEIGPDEAPGSGEATPKRGRNSRKDPSEDDIAIAFTERHRDTLRFDHDVGHWYEWDGTRWCKDTRHRAFTYARVIARQLDGAGKASFASGVEKFARADPAHAVDSSIWDTDPMLLGTPAGTIDLKTGRMRTARPSDHITKQTSCAPIAEKPERWLQFLDETLAKDAEMIRFLQQWLGYCLTGDTREQVLVFLHGDGGNGKGVVVNTVKRIFADYGATAGMETFTASKYDRHTSELAVLKGSRLVTASETEEGRSWAEARIKEMTGGDPITANLMRQDKITFLPQFKLIFAGNHKPSLRNVDEAMRRRFNLVPFLNKPAKKDLQLEAKLAAEHGQILAWMIEGCVDWLKSGLLRPAKVADATNEYLADQDMVSQWLAERCEKGPGKFEQLTPTYQSWCDFAKEAGEEPGDLKSLKSALERHGVHAKRSNGIRAFRGLALRGKPQASESE